VVSGGDLRESEGLAVRYLRQGLGSMRVRGIRQRKTCEYEGAYLPWIRDALAPIVETHDVCKRRGPARVWVWCGVVRARKFEANKRKAVKPLDFASDPLSP
jgi:hypothetical protein